VLAQKLFVEKAGLPPALINQIKRLAAFQNPEFYKKQSMRLSTATTPRVVARKVSTIHRYVVATRKYLDEHPRVKEPGDLKTHVWLSLSLTQFGGTPESITLMGPHNQSQTLRIASIFVTEGVSSLRNAALEGLGVSVLPLWLIHEDLASGHLVHVLPEWTATPIPLSVIHLAQRALPARVRAFLDFAAVRIAAELEPPASKRRAKS
jgi:DNA-binding transcriptional LysR family regulator